MARAEILEKKIIGFFEDLKTPKGQFEINWPLVGPSPLFGRIEGVAGRNYYLPYQF